MDSIKEMSRAVKCLSLELPESVINDIRKKWEDVLKEIEQLKETSGCSYAGKGRGDCEHFIGLPGKSITGQHDGEDDTVDVYGKPNGWCWSCWKSYQIERLKKEKEWLIDNWQKFWFRKGGYPYLTPEKIKDKILKEMQQALKEVGSANR